MHNLALPVDSAGAGRVICNLGTDAFAVVMMIPRDQAMMSMGYGVRSLGTDSTGRDCLRVAIMRAYLYSWSVLLRHWWQWSGHFMVRFPVIRAVK